MKQNYNNQEFLLGIDTGTSKTHALISDTSGKVHGFGIAGSGNYEVVGKENMILAMQSAVDQALLMAGIDNSEIKGMGFGLSGYDWPSEKPLMIDAIEALTIKSPYQFVNDVVIGLFAGASEGWGVAVDAGTGNNVRGIDEKGVMGRITGNSVQFGEFGGGGEMVWRAMVAVIYAWTLRGPKTRLTQLMVDFSEVEDEEALIEHLAMGRLHLPASLALDIFRLAHEGDRISHEIINFSAQELAKNTNAVIKQLNFQDRVFEVILIGSVFDAGEIYLDPFQKTIHAFAPGAKFIRLETPPVVGAVVLAAKTVGIENPDFRSNLQSSMSRLLDH